MTQFAPVQPPPLPAPPISLVTSARNPLAGGAQTDTVTGDDVRWEQGFAFQPLPNVFPTTRSQCSSAHVDHAESASEPVVVSTVPWVIQTQDHCSTMGWRGRDYAARARAALEAATPKGVEHEFWTGAIAQADGAPNLYLANGTATDVTPTAGTAVPIEEAVNLLEQALADCGAGARGMIHCAPVATPSLAVVRREGLLLLTARDTIVVPGAGYPGTSPAGAAPAAGTSWLYGTGVVDVRLSPIEIFGESAGGTFDFAPFLDRTINDVVVKAQRVAAATWDGTCHFAVLAQIPTAT